MDSLERSNLTIAYDPALIIISTAKRAFLRAERLRRVGESFNLLGVWKSSSVPGPLKTPHRLSVSQGHILVGPCRSANEEGLFVQ